MVNEPTGGMLPKFPTLIVIVVASEAGVDVIWAPSAGSGASG